MLKYAYQLGIKLALEEEGLLEADANMESKGEVPPAELLAAQMKRLPAEDGKAPPEFNAIDKSDENDYFNFGHKNYHWAFDDVSRFGLDIQAPVSNAV